MMNEWQKERLAKAKVFQRLVSNIAKFLGDEWTYKPPINEESIDWYASLENGSGMALSLHRDDHKKQIMISGTFPTSKVSNEYFRPYEYRSGIDIHVSENRSADAIAKDINRRLMPEYIKAFGIAMDQMKQSDDYHTKSKALLEELCNIAICRLNPGREHSASFNSAKADSIYGEIRVNGDNADINIHGLPADLAKEILKLLTY